MIERDRAAEEAARLGEGERKCPDCGRPLGDLTVCPRCGTDLTKRTSHKFLALICIVSLAGGMIYFLYSVLAGAYMVDIGDIDEGLNYGFVWIEGTVSNGPQYQIYPSVKLSFDVYDGTGEIMKNTIDVRAFSSDAKWLVDENKVPRVGDHVKLFGTVRIDEQWGNKIYLEKPEEFEITRQSPTVTTISEVNSDYYAGEKFFTVTVDGVLTNLRDFSWADIYTIEENIEDETTGDTISVYVHSGLEYLGGEQPENLGLLSRLRITAGVSEYSGQPQLVPSSYEEIEVIGQASLPDVVSSDELENYNGRLVGVRGEIVFTEISSSGRRLWLDNADDNEGPHPVWIWSSTYGQISEGIEGQLRRGAIVELYGEVSMYGGEWQVELASPPEIHVLDNSGISTYEIGLVDIRTLTENNVGDFVRVGGSASNLSSGGEIFTVENNANEIRVSINDAIWIRMLDEDKPQAGDTVKITGKVGEYAGDIGLYPGIPEDIQVIA